MSEKQRNHINDDTVGTFIPGIKDSTFGKYVRTFNNAVYPAFATGLITTLIMNPKTAPVIIPLLIVPALPFLSLSTKSARPQFLSKAGLIGAVTGFGIAFGFNNHSNDTAQENTFGKIFEETVATNTEPEAPYKVSLETAALRL